MAPRARKSPTAPTAVGYVRVSTDAQVTDGHSIEAQCAAIRRHCEAHGLALLGIEIDEGISGTTERRVGLSRALLALQRGQATHLVTYSLSRLSRSVAHTAALIDRHFRDGRASLVSLSESIDTSTAMGRSMAMMLSVWAATEADLASERTAAIKAHQRSQGRFLGGESPYGYAAVDGALVEIPEEMAVVRRANELRAAGLSLRAVSATLAEAGMLSRRGVAFTAAAINSMLSRAV